jgi:hypothetical protein
VGNVPARSLAEADVVPEDNAAALPPELVVEFLGKSMFRVIDCTSVLPMVSSFLNWRCILNKTALLSGDILLFSAKAESLMRAHVALLCGHAKF